MLKLTRLNLKNFLSHKDTDMNLSDSSGLVLISGKNTSGLYDSNGSGKSTILEGIVYSLTGTTLRGLSVNDVVNRNEKKDTCTKLSLETPEGSFEISRYRKDTQYGDKIQVSKIENGESVDCSKRLNKDTQSFIDNLVDIPYNVLVNTIFLGEGLSSRFTQLSDPEKKSLIESTLNLSYDLNTAKDKASAKLKELKLEKANWSGKISTLESIVSVDISHIDLDIESCVSDIEHFTAEQESARELYERLKLVIESNSSRIKLLENSIREYQDLYNKLSDLDTKTALLVSELNHIEESDTPVCALCHQRLDSQSSKESVKENYTNRIRENTEQMKVWQSQLDSLPDINIMRDKLSQMTNALSKDQQEYYTLSTRMLEIERSLGSARFQKENLENILFNHENYQKELESARMNDNRLDSEIRKYEYLYKLFSPTGLVTVVLEEAIAYINQRIKEYTDILLDKTYQIVLEKGKLSLVDSKGSTYQSLSNGEKRRLDIAIQFSLHDYTHIYCGIGTNLLFIDEILDTLDDTGVNNIITVLNLKREYCKLDSIYVITHNNELKSYFDEVITVVKDTKGNSYIE